MDDLEEENIKKTFATDSFISGHKELSKLDDLSYVSIGITCSYFNATKNPLPSKEFEENAGLDFWIEEIDEDSSLSVRKNLIYISKPKNCNPFLTKKI